MTTIRTLLLLSMMCSLMESAEAGRSRGDSGPPSTPVLTAPTSSMSGSFTLSWSSANGDGVIYTIQESLNDGAFSTVITTRYEGSDSRSYDGTNKVVFQAQACSTAGGCSPWSSPRTVLTGSVSEPIPYDQQLLLEYNVRTGDFDSDGYNDILIERITEGPPDGSFQTTVLEGTAGGVIAKVPSANEINVARSFPSNPQITAGVSDNNFDGFADIVLSGLGSLGSSSYIEDSLILYASGKPYRSQPKGLKFLDEDYA